MSERIRIAKGLRKHIRSELQIARAGGATDSRIDQIKQLRTIYRDLKKEPPVRQLVFEVIPAEDYVSKAQFRDINLIRDSKTITDFLENLRNDGTQLDYYPSFRSKGPENDRKIPVVDLHFREDFASMLSRYDIPSSSVSVIDDKDQRYLNYAYICAKTLEMDLKDKFLIRGNIFRSKRDF